MFFKKKGEERPITPEELGKFVDDSISDPDIEHLHVRRDSAEYMRFKKRVKIFGFVICAVTVTLLAVFAAAIFRTQWGDLVISVGTVAHQKGIVISESSEFLDETNVLFAEQPPEVNNITYSWLPDDLDISFDGSHNGDNYLAYTFYCKNNGRASLDYTAYLEITGVAKSADEAIRVMVFKNGVETVYGKAKYTDRSSAEDDCTVFESDTRVMTAVTEDFDVGDTDKYTVVIWIEGNDPECVDDIRGGYVRMKMHFEIENELSE